MILLERNILLTWILTALIAISTNAQRTPDTKVAAEKADPAAPKVLVVTGARFSYSLIEKWIDEYNKVNPSVQIIVESRGSADPMKYDILAEVQPPDAEALRTREHIYVARYAILPVANKASSVARTFAEKGLNTDLIKQIFFHYSFPQKERQKPVQLHYTAYTRLQKAGVPAVFSKYFGHEQKDLKGTAIAGSDVHLLKALLRDSSAVTYLPLPLIYDERTRKPVEGLQVLPVDLNGNQKVNDEEKFYDTVDHVIEVLESRQAGEIDNLPVEYLHLSVERNQASPEAIDFLKWVNEHGQNYLHAFGYLQPGAERSANKTFNDFTSKRGR